MRTRTALPVFGCFWLVGCLEFREPLGPVSESFIDSRLLGAWNCNAPDEPKASVMTIMDFDGKQYYMHYAEGGEDPASMRAHASHVGERDFLNVIALGGDDGKPDWSFLEYTFPDTGVQFRMVNPTPFEDVRESGPQLRALLEQHLDDTTFFADALTCTKALAQPTTVAPERE